MRTKKFSRDKHEGNEKEHELMINTRISPRRNEHLQNLTMTSESDHSGKNRFEECLRNSDY